MATIKSTFGVFKDRFIVPKGIKQIYPDMHFYYERYTDSNMMIAESNGYELVRPTEEMKKNHPNLYKDNMIKVGDTVLMMCAREQYEQREMDKENMCQLLSQTKKETLKDNVKKLGAEISYK